MTKNLPPTGRSLPIALLRAREVVMAPLRRMLAETAHTEQQWRILRVLSECGALDSKTLANRSSLLLPSLTRIAVAMSNKGLITRTRDKNDHRRQIIDIAPLGQKIINDYSDQAVEILKKFEQILGNDEYEKLLDLLEKLDSGGKN